jgi:hypothetical protein
VLNTFVLLHPWLLLIVLQCLLLCLLQALGANLDSSKLAAERDAANAALSEARNTAAAAQQDAARSGRAAGLCKQRPLHTLCAKCFGNSMPFCTLRQRSRKL